MAITFRSWAYVTNLGGETWTLENGLASLGDGNGPAMSNMRANGIYTIPESIVYSVFDNTYAYDVVGINCGAFQNCDLLTEVVMPNSVTNIGDAAFSGCSSLSSFTIPIGVKRIGAGTFGRCSSLARFAFHNGVTYVDKTAFADCGGLKDLTIPQCICDSRLSDIFPESYQTITNVVICDGVTRIACEAFYKCRNLANITICGDVLSIEWDAFDGCPGLTSVRIPSIWDWLEIQFGSEKANPLYYAHDLYAKGALVKDLTIPQYVTRIGRFAFNGCSLTSVIMPNGVMDIGACAFYNCNELTSVAMPNTIKNIADNTFKNCSKLANVAMPNNVTNIGYGAFRNCSELPSLAMPNTVRSVGDYAFYNCSRIESITIPSSVVHIGKYAFAGCNGLTHVVIPDSVTSIGSDAFANCSNISSINIPQCLCTNRLSNVFRNVSSAITNVVIASGVTSIGDEAFASCYGLTSVAIPNSVKKIGRSAFNSCNALRSVTIPDNVKNIDDFVFGGCSGLVDVTMPDGVTNIGFSAFGWCSDLKSVSIPNRVARIGASAFYGCSSLTNVSIPQSVIYIGNEAFRMCSGMFSFEVDPQNPSYKSVRGLLLTKNGESLIYGVNGDVIVPNTVACIEDFAFYNCSGLTSIIIPNSVTNIGDCAFSGCSNLESVYVPEDYAVATWTFPRTAAIIRYRPSITVEFDSAGGDVIDPQIVHVGLPYGTLPTPVRSGYTFRGWDKNDVAIEPDTVVADVDDHMLVAQWSPNRYAVTFYSNGGREGSSYRWLEYGSAIVAPTVTRTGYTFSGWSPEVAVTVPASNLTYTAQWTVNQYTVTFDANGGTGGTSGEQDYGSSIVSPTVAREGYTFAGWSPAVAAAVPASDVTYVARWTPNKYTVTFNANGGEGGTSTSLDCGSSIVAPKVTRTGYTFNGWLPDVAETVPASNVTYVAQWTRNKYTVTFNANGGIGGASGKQDYGSSIVAPKVTREGYTFAGWSPTVAATVPTSDVTYTAQWIINQYTVTFNANGGTGGKTVMLDYGTAIAAPNVTREGYTFAGWSPTVLATVPATDVTYVAQWTRNKYTVTFDANGGTGSTSGKQDYGSSIVAPTVTRTGYTFSGWSPTVTSTVPANDVTYVAQWTRNKYTVTFDANGGTGGTSGKKDYGSAIVAPTVMRTGYTFTGWSPSVAATVPAFDVTYVAQWEQIAPTFTVNAYGILTDVSLNGAETAVIPSSVRLIGYEAFYKCRGELRNVVIPDSVKTIQVSAFSGCSGLTTVTIPNSVTSIEPFAFENCVGLTNVTIGTGVEYIGLAAFLGCTGLTSMTIPNGVTDIGDYAFSGCINLADVTIPDSVTSIGTGAFFSTPFYDNLADGPVVLGRILYVIKGSCPSVVTISDGVACIADFAFENCSDLRNVTIPNSVRRIGNHAFYGCSGLTSVTIPNSVRSIGSGAFGHCTSLTSTTIPNGVTEIGEDTFAYCGNLKDVTIGSCVEYIGEYAFGGCGKLSKIVFKGDAPLLIHHYVFDGVPQDSTAFVSPKSTGWGANVGEDWNGLILQYWPEKLITAESDFQVGEIMSTFSDEGLAALVSTVAEYDTLRTWVNNNNLYQSDVVANTNAAAAFLLGAERLFENAPKVEFGEVGVADGESSALGITRPTMTVSVTVKDGEEAVKCAAEKVKEMFEATSDLGDWGGEAKLTPAVSVEAGEGATMRFKVTPGDGAATRAFLRIRK